MLYISSACDAFCSCAVCYHSGILKDSFIERAIASTGICLHPAGNVCYSYHRDHSEQETKF